VENLARPKDGESFRRPKTKKKRDLDSTHHQISKKEHVKAHKRRNTVEKTIKGKNIVW